MPQGLFYAQAPAEYAALMHAEMDLLEAAPAAYAAWVRADGEGGSFRALARRALGFDADDTVRSYVQREDVLRTVAPVAYAAREAARRAFVAATTRLYENRFSTMPFIRFSRMTTGALVPALAVGDAVGWRRAARAAAKQREQHALARLREVAPVEYAALAKHGSNHLHRRAALIEAAPTAYAAWKRASSDLARISPADFFGSQESDLFGDS